MTQALTTDSGIMSTSELPFVDRRQGPSTDSPAGRERRQFSDGRQELSDEARELATAIDAYKMQHRRRFINYEEMLGVLKELGYHR